MELTKSTLGEKTTLVKNVLFVRTATVENMLNANDNTSQVDLVGKVGSKEYFGRFTRPQLDEMKENLKPMLDLLDQKVEQEQAIKLEIPGSLRITTHFDRFNPTKVYFRFLNDGMELNINAKEFKKFCEEFSKWGS